MKKTFLTISDTEICKKKKKKIKLADRLFCVLKTAYEIWERYIHTFHSYSPLKFLTIEKAHKRCAP